MPRPIQHLPARYFIKQIVTKVAAKKSFLFRQTGKFQKQILNLPLIDDRPGKVYLGYLYIFLKLEIELSFAPSWVCRVLVSGVFLQQGFSFHNETFVRTSTTVRRVAVADSCFDTCCFELEGACAP